MKTRFLPFLCTATLVASLAALSAVTTARAADEPKPAIADDPAGEPVGIIPVPEGLTAADVKEVLIRAYTARKWQIQKSTDGEMAGYYVRGKNEATLTARYTDKEIRLFCRGQARGGGVPMRWVDNLKKDLGVFLGQKLATKK